MREEFEKLEKVKEILENKFNGVVFNDDLNQYETPCYSTFVPEYVYELNFGWYAYQEQQKKINIIEKLRDSQFEKLMSIHELVGVAEDGHYGFTCEGGDIDLFAKEIKELLK